MTIIKRLHLIWLLFKNKKTPWVVRLMLLVGFAYILLPFDLIPDNFVILGWMDDLALAVVLVAGALKFTPEELVAKLMAKLESKK